MTRVFVIHGMGEHKDGWWLGNDETPEGGLAECKKLPRFDTFNSGGRTLDYWMGGNPFKEIEWIEINYDKEMEQLRTSTNYGETFGEFIEEARDLEQTVLTPHAIESWQSEWQGEAANFNIFNESEFLQRAVWDVFVVMNKLTRHFIAMRVAQKISEHFQGGNERASYSILAHSLGTAVIQDALNILNGEFRPHAGESIPSARTTCLLANFSRTLVGDKVLVTKDPISTDKTAVWPSSYGRESITRHYISARHAMDPLSYLAQDMPLAEDWGGENERFSRGKYLVRRHKDMSYLPRQANGDVIETSSYLHSIQNYLSSPSIHLPFFSRVHSDMHAGYGSASMVSEAQKKFLEVSAPNLDNIANLSIDGDLSKKDWREKVIEKLLDVI